MAVQYSQAYRKMYDSRCMSLTVHEIHLMNHNLKLHITT